MNPVPKDLKNWIEKEFFNAAPVFIAALDNKLNIVYANAAFENRFGRWDGKKCFNVYKKQNTKCENCTTQFAFLDAKPGVTEQSGMDINGRRIHYIKHTVPVADDTGKVNFLVEVSTETTRFKKKEEEYKLLFDQVPCHVIIINRDFKIVRNNKSAEKMIASLQGEFCYEILKGRKEKCLECTAQKTFEDGRQNTGYHVWHLGHDKTAHMHVITILIKGDTPQQDLVMELAVDISNTVKLQSRLEDAHHYLESLINTSMDGIVGISQRGKVEVFNTAARTLFNIKAGQIVSLEDINTMIPKGFLAQVSEERGHVLVPEARLKTSDGESFLGRLTGNRLKESDQSIGMAFSVHDISPLKKLEEEKIEAERMAIVGHTVAGLAHGIKNLINALDGGMYFLKSGIGKGDITRVHKGIETLARNINRIRGFSKAFLNFARFRSLSVAICQPADIISEVLDSFASQTQEKKIKLTLRQDQLVAPAPMDYEKIHEALTNLVGNAIDAFTADAFSDEDAQNEKSIIVNLFEEEGAIYIEVKDNGCGIDDEQKKRLFQKFFTTKGLEGTGLGLLMTKKIIHEHGGNISVFSKKGEGSVFRIWFLRGRLPKPTE